MSELRCMQGNYVIPHQPIRVDEGQLPEVAKENDDDIKEGPLKGWTVGATIAVHGSNFVRFSRNQPKYEPWFDVMKLPS